MRSRSSSSSTAPPRITRSTSPDDDSARKAQRRLRFDEFLRMQVGLVAASTRSRATPPGSRTWWTASSGRLPRRLPFELTGDQRAAIDEIVDDMARPDPMHRLLQGDVGSGKTVVAMTALLVAVQGGHRAALRRRPRSSPNSSTPWRRRCLGPRGAERGDAARGAARQGGAADQPRGAATGGDPRRTGGRGGRHRRGHARPDLRRRAVHGPRAGGHRRAAPLRRGAARAVRDWGRHPTCW